MKFTGFRLAFSPYKALSSLVKLVKFSWVVWSIMCIPIAIYMLVQHIFLWDLGNTILGILIMFGNATAIGFIIYYTISGIFWVVDNKDKEFVVDATGVRIDKNKKYKELK
jgi:hypothetical protein